jgi:hypothetical protein
MNWISHRSRLCRSAALKDLHRSVCHRSGACRNLLEAKPSLVTSSSLSLQHSIEEPLFRPPYTHSRTAMISTTAQFLSLSIFAALSSAAASASTAAAAAAASTTVRGPFPGAVSIINATGDKTTYVLACPSSIPTAICKSHLQVWTATDGPPGHFGWQAIDVQGDDGFQSQSGTAVTRTAATVAPATVTQDAQCRVEADVVVECEVHYSGVGLSPQEQALMDKENLQRTRSTSIVLKPMTAVAGVEKLVPGATGTATTATATEGKISSPMFIAEMHF